MVDYFLLMGARVVAISRSETKPSVSGDFLMIRNDIANKLQITDILEKLALVPDILINNAGQIIYKPLMEISREEIEKLFDVNLISTFILTKHVAKLMIKNNCHGVIVNTLSYAVQIPSVGTGMYAASKAALASLTRTLAAELAPYNIRVNGYSPGVIRTAMTKTTRAQDELDTLNNIALNRIGLPTEMVEIVAFLASERSAYITGCNLDATGGKFIVQNASVAWRKSENH